jgi:hypothetical protein
MKQVFDWVANYDEEDSGAARIMELLLEHSTFDPFLQAHRAGKKIRVTVEIID